jgi:hypothetical protein
MTSDDPLMTSDDPLMTYDCLPHQVAAAEAAREIAGTLSKSTNKLYLDSASLLLDVQNDGNTMNLKAFGKGDPTPKVVAVEPAESPTKDESVKE